MRFGPFSGLAWRARRLVGRGVRRAARPALAGPGSPVQELKDRVERIEHAPGPADEIAALRRELDTRLHAEAVERVEIVYALDAVRRHFEGRVEALEGFVERSSAPPYLAGEPFERFDVEGAGRVVGFRQGAAPVGEDAYASFEDVFRGPEDRVRERQRPYIELLRGLEPVLDFGCGRGEMLDLLRDAGIAARGVDTDAGMIARCRAKGHEHVEHGDGVAALEAAEPGSLGAVFSAQVVEHLPFPALERMLAAGRRALRPGGVLIAETVNPHAPDALKAFWLDPTHQHPLFPEVLLVLCRNAGFASAYAFHPTGTGSVDADRSEQPAYAVVATA